MATARPAKLHGRAFYESIGSPKLILAPMVDRSEFVSNSPLNQRPTLTSMTGMESSYKIILR